jgi:hypothetical protein
MILQLNYLSLTTSLPIYQLISTKHQHPKMINQQRNIKHNMYMYMCVPKSHSAYSSHCPRHVFLLSQEYPHIVPILYVPTDDSYLQCYYYSLGLKII